MMEGEGEGNPKQNEDPRRGKMETEGRRESGAPWHGLMVKKKEEKEEGEKRK